MINAQKLLVPGQAEPQSYYANRSLITPDWKPGDYQPDSSKPHYNPYNKPTLVSVEGKPIDHHSEPAPGMPRPQGPESKMLHLPPGVFSIEPPEVAPGSYQPDSSKPHYNPYHKPNLDPLSPVPQDPSNLVIVETPQVTQAPSNQ